MSEFALRKMFLRPAAADCHLFMDFVVPYQPLIQRFAE